jgi:hypothetical protein
MKRVAEETMIAACRRYDISKAAEDVGQAKCPLFCCAAPLSHAAVLGNLDMVRCLVRKLGADVN